MSGLINKNLREVKILKLNNNRISKIGHLSELVKLYELDLSKNLIRSIDKNSFPVPNVLSCLKLEDNQLK